MRDGRTYSLSEIRKSHPRAYDRWSGDEDLKLSRAFRDGATVSTLAGAHQRNPSAIQSRLRKLGLTA